MLASSAYTKRLIASSRRFCSTVPIKQVASVLKLNVGNEETALKMDSAFSSMNTMMKAHPGYQRANRYVCKTEWAYEVSFIFGDLDSFKAWQSSAVREEVHSNYLNALKDAGIPEDKVYGGARVYDEWA
jgi:antibiotic biosynthesis monooxygenase (ABM) superfamily enzyme